MEINPIHINTIGLIFDIAGAWLVALEVVRKFHGKKIDKDPHLYAADDPPYETEEYKKWESSKHKFMWYGLICLTIGFGLQIASNYLNISNTKNIVTHRANNEISAATMPNVKRMVDPVELEK